MAETLRRRAAAARGEERGSALIVAMMITVLATVVLGSLLALSSASQQLATANAGAKVERYSADGALTGAINWARDTWNVGRDPSVNGSDPRCLYYTPTQSGTMTVSCAATTGSDSGKPASGGLAPPDPLILVGDRMDEPGPYNVPSCRGWWDDVKNWFSQSGDVNTGDTGPPEYSMYVQPRKGLGVLGASCNVDKSRQFGAFKVGDGDVVAGGRIEVKSDQPGFISLPSGGGYSIKARRGCSFGSCPLPGTRADGKPEDSDPGRADPANPGVNPTDIGEAYRPIGFNTDGSPQTGFNWVERTTAYKWDPATKALTAVASCPTGAATTVVFLPGWYRNSEVLNRYTADPACADRTFWFAPDPGPDGVLLTADDKTGAYYFDLRQGSGRACGGMSAKPSRWCIGGSGSQNSRVLAGTPNGWTPLGDASTATDDPADPRHPVKVSIPTANTVDSDLSVTWSNPANAKTIDGSLAKYQPCSFLFITCPSIDRAIRLRDYTPDVVSGPLEDLTYAKGRVFLNVAYGIQGGNGTETPKVEVAAVGKDSGRKDCGSYPITRLTYGGTGPVGTYRFTDAQAASLAEKCGKVDLINGLEITLKVQDNNFNAGVPKVWLDGMSVDYDSYQGALFPAPDPATPGQAAARSDCDTTKPGAQLTFGGESHVYVADGSMEVCAGAHPDGVETHQQIGVWAMPEVASIRPSGSGITGSGDDYKGLFPQSGQTVATALSKIDGKYLEINYGGCAAFCFQDYEEGRINIPMQAYSAPSGYHISKIQARVSYDPESTGCSFLWGCPGQPPELIGPNCPTGIANDLPKNPTGPFQVANTADLKLYDEAGGFTCLTPTQLAGGPTLTWAARAACVVGVCKAGGGDFTDKLDGIELQITLAPDDTTKPRLIPQSGCAVAHPNYNAGEGKPDCALIRADLAQQADSWTVPWATREATWTGRFSIKGTLYAPSAAVDVDDTDYAYPLVTRGAVLRHLRVAGWGARTAYDGLAISNKVDRTPTPREMTFTACTQSAARRAAYAACDAGEDTVLATTLVRFDLDKGLSEADAYKKSRLPKIQWWHALR